MGGGKCKKYIKSAFLPVIHQVLSVSYDLAHKYLICVFVKAYSKTFNHFFINCCNFPGNMDREVNHVDIKYSKPI